MDRIFDGRRLRQARLDAGVSLEQAAEAAGRSVFTVRAYEVGSVEPPVNVLARLGRLLLHPIDDFLTETGAGAAA